MEASEPQHISSPMERSFSFGSPKAGSSPQLPLDAAGDDESPAEGQQLQFGRMTARSEDGRASDEELPCGGELPPGQIAGVPGRQEPQTRLRPASQAANRRSTQDSASAVRRCSQQQVQEQEQRKHAAAILVGSIELGDTQRLSMTSMRDIVARRQAGSTMSTQQGQLLAAAPTAADVTAAVEQWQQGAEVAECLGDAAGAAQPMQASRRSSGQQQQRQQVLPGPQEDWEQHGSDKEMAEHCSQGSSRRSSPQQLTAARRRWPAEPHDMPVGTGGCPAGSSEALQRQAAERPSSRSAGRRPAGRRPGSAGEQPAVQPPASRGGHSRPPAHATCADQELDDDDDVASVQYDNDSLAGDCWEPAAQQRGTRSRRSSTGR